MRNSQEIHDQVRLADQVVKSGATTETKKTYEEGVQDALKWTLGELHTAPIAETRQPQTA